MSNVASFKPYGRGERVYVVLANIVWFESYSSNCDSGTKLHLVEEVELLVGESPNDVANAIELISYSPPIIDPQLEHFVAQCK
tara:strand:+ start:2132 stop:2380 length:249 start_codon:yes stop_codon:yes gene_type:complete